MIVAWARSLTGAMVGDGGIQEIFWSYNRWNLVMDEVRRMKIREEWKVTPRLPTWEMDGYCNVETKPVVLLQPC